jgi:hypothetical protein
MNACNSRDTKSVPTAEGAEATADVPRSSHTRIAAGTLATAVFTATEGTPTMVASNSKHLKGRQQTYQDLLRQATAPGMLATAR